METQNQAIITEHALRAAFELLREMMRTAEQKQECAELLARGRAAVHAGARLEIAFAFGPTTDVTLSVVDAQGKRFGIAQVPVQMPVGTAH